MMDHSHFAKNIVLVFSIIFFSACSDDSPKPKPVESAEASAMAADTPTDDPTATTASVQNASLQGQLQKIVDQAVDSGLPGVSLHVQHGDENISVVAGVVNRDTGELLTPASRFQIASIGKTYVATMFMRFVDMGVLQLDDPIDSLLDAEMSALLGKSDMITVEMLLAHTSGLPEYADGTTDFFIDYLGSSERLWTPTEALSYIEGKDNLFEPGKEFAYSNTNYLLLGVIAERVTDEPLGSALRQWVFQPAGLMDTYGALEELGQPEMVHGYVPASAFGSETSDLGLPVSGTDLDTFGRIDTHWFGDAPIQSTPTAMNSFIRTLIDTDELISGETKTRMLTESFPGSSAYGLGIQIADNATLFQHSGQHYGLTSLLSYRPSQDISFATAVNASNGSYDPLIEKYVSQLAAFVNDLRLESAK